MNRQTRLATLLRANWNEVGSGATIDDEQYAQKTLQAALRKLVKDPNAKYKENRIYLGDVKDFFPRVMWQMANVMVFWNPTIVDYAASVTQLSKGGFSGIFVEIGKMGYKHRGSGRSLGGSFIHEVEHLYDLMVEKSHETKGNTGGLSEFTPRLRQMLRHLKDEPGFRIWNYIHPKHGESHTENYVDRHLGGVESYFPTEEERQFAIKAVQKRAKEIYDNMVAQNLI